jgi:flagellar biosynthesis/type III secretory pathway chaperone
MALKRQLKEVNKELEKWESKESTNLISKWIRDWVISGLYKKKCTILTQLEINKINYRERHK